MMDDILVAREPFPNQNDKNFRALFEAHGQEVRGRPMLIQWGRYRELQNRFVWIVARDITSYRVIGYSGHYFYMDLHFSDKVAADDLWYVIPAARGKGIGRRVREIGLANLKALGVTTTYDFIRDGGPDLTKLGYEKWGTRWMKHL
jgi:GNAT superfamily N-acetyltransferase